MSRPKIGTRTSIKAIRRRDVQRAAYDVVVERGFGGATISRVAEKLGMSRGTVYQYFPDKHVLFETAVRYTNAQLSEAVIERMQLAATPRERLQAIIEGTFSERVFDAETARFWLSFCSEVANIPRFARLQKVLFSRMRTNLLHELKQLSSVDEASCIAEETSIYLDGLWMRRGLDPDGMKPDKAISLASNFLETRLTRRLKIKDGISPSR